MREIATDRQRLRATFQLEVSLIPKPEYHIRFAFFEQRECLRAIGRLSDEGKFRPEFLQTRLDQGWGAYRAETCRICTPR